MKGHEFNQMQETLRIIMERLDVRDWRNRSGASTSKQVSSRESNVSSERHDGRCKGIDNIKLKIPPFTCSKKLEEFLDWVPQVVKVFDCCGWDEHTKLKMVSLAFSNCISL